MASCMCCTEPPALGADGGAAAALLPEPGRTTTRSAARHEAGDAVEAQPDPKDTVLEGAGHLRVGAHHLFLFVPDARKCAPRCMTSSAACATLGTRMSTTRDV